MVLYFAGSIYVEGVGTGPGQADDWLCICRLHSVIGWKQSTAYK